MARGLVAHLAPRYGGRTDGFLDGEGLVLSAIKFADEVQPAYSAGVLLLIAALAVLVLLFLIMKLKLHAFVALILVSFLTALATKIPFTDVVPTMLTGFGNTLASVALLVGLGAMIGRLLEVTGGAQVLADTLINRFGAERAPFALGVASLLFGFPIFFDAGLVVMLPIIFSVARRFGGSVLTYALPAAGAFAVMHAFVPPHPGPVAAGELLGADIGLVLVIGLLIGLPTWFIAAYLFGTFTGRRINIPVPELLAGGPVAEAEDAQSRPLPSFGTVLAVLLLPLILIFFNTGLNTLATAGTIDGDATWVGVVRMFGQTAIALLITVLFAMVALVLRASGIGEALAGSLDNLGLPVIVAAFVVSTALRVAQGSATVALTTTAGLMAPTVAATSGLSSIDLAAIVVAIACGATVLSHVNDSGFWLVGRFLGMDEKTTLKTWTVMETLIGSVGFVFALIVSALF